MMFFAVTTQSFGQTVSNDQPVSTAALRSEVRDFMAKEVAVHFAAVRSIDPPPDKVNGSITTGEYTWGSFMRVVAAQSDIGGSRMIAGRDTARLIAEMGLYEARKGGKAFSQLYAAQALRHFGADLSKNAVWQSMNDAERKEWTSLLDATRIYDPVKREVINLPENYLGVAARIAAYAYEFGVMKDRAFLDSLIERAAKQFTNGAIYSDDDLPNGRYDRYSNEYARFCWNAAEVVGRKDILEKLKPSLKAQMKLWWDLVSDKGYGYNWGRSQGLVSYLDTLEIAAFLGDYPEFRPAPITDIASIYNLAWRWIRGGYIDDRHTFNLFSYGRGNYAYISTQREFQQISTSFAKIIVAHESFMKTLDREKLAEIPADPALGQVSRFEFFEATKDRAEGVWLVRQGNLKFALPITVGTKPGISDYLAAPYGLAGFANPVEEVYPALVPFIELEDGKTYVASEGSSSIERSKDGQSLRVIWRKWGRIGSKSGERFDIGITSEVRWRIVGDKLERVESLTTNNNLKIKRWWVAVPTTADRSRVEINGKKRTDIFDGREGTLKVTATADWAFATSLYATGDSKLSKGVLGAIPLHLIYSTDNLLLTKNKPVTWQLDLEVSK
ncbi:MAG: hypothetical protein KA956_06725 [Pyrinomonadaceae bacterium]|nr:hypothetical protein [Pyrinomonadaceae bacterium]